MAFIRISLVLLVTSRGLSKFLILPFESTRVRFQSRIAQWGHFDQFFSQFSFLVKSPCLNALLPEMRPWHKSVQFFTLSKAVSWPVLLADRGLLLLPKLSHLHGKQLEAESFTDWLHQVEGGALCPVQSGTAGQASPAALEHSGRQRCLSPLSALPVVPGCSTRAWLCLRTSCCRAQWSQWESPQGAQWDSDQVFEAV